MDLNDAGWVDVVREYVSRAATRGAAAGYHEIYNEPDIRDGKSGDPIFYAGGLEDYIDLYRATATTIREVDPHARIGGPALGLTQLNAHWLRALLEVAESEDLPMDFLSFHHYDFQTLSGSVEAVLAVLAEFQGFPELELHLNEYNTFPVDYPRGGPQDEVWMASSFAAEIPRLLEYPLARTHWAQFLDSGNENFSGMVDIDGRPKHVFWVYEFYQSMPLDRRAVVVDGPPGVGAIAEIEPGV
jgi:xylan 1,4-beta-xylosidase